MILDREGNISKADKEISMSLATKLGMKTRKQERQEQRENVAEIKRKIRASDQTVIVLGRTVKCVDANTVSGYRFTGSGLVWWDGKVIERMDWQKRLG